jgi:hypothetical protein
VFETPFDARNAAPEINKEREKAGLKPVIALKQYSAGRWHFLYYLSLSVLFGLVAITATAQERAARTYAGGGVAFVGSTAKDGGAVAGVYVDTAYDLRYGFQARFGGEYRKGAVIPRLFTGADDRLLPASEIRYGGALVYHVGQDVRIRPFVGGGIFSVHQFFAVNPRPQNQSGPDRIYDANVNSLLLVGVGIGKRAELSFTKYFTDTYSYSELRGYGFDFSRVQRVSGRLHFRVGAKVRRWTFYEGEGHYDKRAVEIGGFAGFQFQ